MFKVAGADFSSIETDSRKITRSALFVALAGDKFDGHDFILATLKAGASGVICRADWSGLKEAQAGFPNAKFICVKDPLTEYREIAKAWRKNFKFPVVAVAGSVGKTTTKEMLAAILAGKYPSVLKTTGSQNGFVGIPMTLLLLRPSHQAAVIEVGIDEPGTMTGHMDTVSADIAVLPAIGPEHLEKLVDVATVAREEAAALEWIAAHRGTAVVRLDDEWIAPLAKKLNGAKVITCGMNVDADCSGKFENDTLTVDFSGKAEKFPIPLPGEHNASNLLVAISVAHALGLTADEIRKGLMTFETAKGRTEIKKLAKGATFICDYYNANPSSMVAALRLLNEEGLKGSGKKIACLGDMLELGPNEEKFHLNLQPLIERLGVSVLLLYGPRMRWLYDEMEDSKVKTYHFETHAELGKFLLEQLNAEDVVLIKGSRGMKMEEILKSL